MTQPSEPFGADDRLADAIAADPAVVERLVALDPWFGRLDVPEARRTIGALATVRDAAAAAKVPLDSVIRAINAGRTAPCCICPAADDGEEAVEPAPAWFEDFDAKVADRIDVKPILAAKQEPFAMVMRAANSIPVGRGLIIDAPFNPRPLRRVLEGKGFATHGARGESGDWRIRCLRAADDGTAAAGAAGDDEQCRIWRAEDGVHIDVRGLEAPTPLTRILTLIDGGEHQGVIIVHHHREPIYLYPELAERGWTYTLLTGTPGEVRLELRRER